jgi:hypothetical protein
MTLSLGFVFVRATCPIYTVMQNDSHKLRWYAPIWKDPLGWARWVGNSRLHLVCAVGLQLVFWGIWIGSLLCFATVRSIGESGWLRQIPFVFLLAVGFVASVFIPATYLYALYRLIRIIDEKSKEA